MNEQDTSPEQWVADVKKNVLRLHCWTAAWVVSIFILSFGAKHVWDFDTSMTVLMVCINFAMGIAMIVAQARLLKRMDEMQERILLEAAAITLGVTLVFAGSYQLWESIKLISFEPQVWHVVCLMGLTHVVSTFSRVRRYR